MTVENRQALVSVIMNCRNSATFLEEAIQSVFSQTYQNWEIIFYDNLSTDESPNIAKKYIGKLKYVRGTKPLSLGEARNEAIQEASGKYIAILDCDDLWVANKLEKQIEIFEKDSQMGLVYSNCHFVDQKGEVIHSGMVPREPPKDSSPAFSLISEGCYIPCPTIVLKKEAVIQNQGFNATYHYAEEFDLCVRVALTWKVGYVDQKLAFYRIHGKNESIIGEKNLLRETIQVMKDASKQMKLSLSHRLKLWFRYLILNLAILKRQF